MRRRIDEPRKLEALLVMNDDQRHARRPRQPYVPRELRIRDLVVACEGVPVEEQQHARGGVTAGRFSEQLKQAALGGKRRGLDRAGHRPPNAGCFVCCRCFDWGVGPLPLMILSLVPSRPPAP
jgi:hypothetical protein